MKKIVTVILLLYISSLTYSQSLIKFTETPFTLTENVKDAAGYSYTATQVDLEKNQILMLSAESPHFEFKPVIIIECPVINGKTATIEIKSQEYFFYKYEMLATIKETGKYTIVVVSAEKGKVGNGILKSGMRPTGIINNNRIFAMPQQNPFADALSANLRLAIFNFKYGVTKIPRDNKFSNKQVNLDSTVITSFPLPGSLPNKAESDYTKVKVFQIMTKDGKPKYEYGAQYCMGLINFEYIPNVQSERKRPYLETYNFKDTAILLKTYDSLKTVLVNNLSKDFSIERETSLPILATEMFPLITRKDGYNDPSGKSIVFTNTTNSRILPDGHNFKFLAEKQMKIELIVERINYDKCGLFIRIYSSNGVSLY